MFIEKTEAKQARDFLNKIKGKKAVIHLGSTSDRRGFNKFESDEIIELLIKNNFKIILLFGISSKNKVISIHPKTISFSVGLIKNCDLFLGSDSGPANIAAALKTPSIIISKIIPPHLRFLKRSGLKAFYKYNIQKINSAIKEFS